MCSSINLKRSTLDGRSQDQASDAGNPYQRNASGSQNQENMNQINSFSNDLTNSNKRGSNEVSKDMSNPADLSGFIANLAKAGKDKENLFLNKKFKK